MGVHDAVNLGWKLAQVVRGQSPHSLLDTYFAERHPVTARTLRRTMASVALRREDDRTGALRDIVTELLSVQEARTRTAAELSGLDIAYGLGGGHPVVGRRIPDLDLVIAGKGVRLYTLLQAARPVFLDFGTGRFDIAPWADRIVAAEAACAPEWDLPVIGTVTAPAAVLIRPDGHVAWAGDAADRGGLSEALTAWVGAPHCG